MCNKPGITQTINKKSQVGHRLIESFEAVMQQYSHLLARVAAAYEANESLQQELYQEICVAVWQALQRFNGDASIKTYILRVAHNRGVTHVSKEMKTLRASNGDDSSQYVVDASSYNRGAEQQLMQSQQVDKLLNGIRQLKLPSRQIITLSLEGLSYAEIAEVTGLTVSNIGVIITRVKQTLKRQLENE